MRPLIFASLQPELAEAKGVPLRFVSHRLPRHRGAGGIGMRADRRRAAGVHADGRPAGRRAAPHHRLVERAARSPAALALAEAWLGITIAYLHRLAGELLHRVLERARLFRRLVRRPAGARRRRDSRIGGHFRARDCAMRAAVLAAWRRCPQCRSHAGLFASDRRTATIQQGRPFGPARSYKKWRNGS